MGASDRYCLRWNNHQKNLISVMDDLLKNQTLTDVTLGVEDGRFLKCHKVILATCSPYFRTLFIEVPTSHPIILLKDVRYAEIKAILEFMYKGEVNVAYDDMAALFQVAELLQVKGLVAGAEPGPSSSVTSSAAARGENSQPASASRSRSRRNSSSYPPGKVGNPEEPKVPAAWATSQLFGPDDPRSAINALANFQPFLPSSQAPFPFAQFHDEAATRRSEETNGPGTSNRETPVLRSALHPELEDRPRESRGQKNGSNHSGDPRDRRASFDFSQQSPKHSETSMIDDESPSVSQMSSEDSKYGVIGYGASNRQEIKRYKKYSRKDIWNAITAVQGGLSANKAAELFNVPSRTLYDKIKKLGIPPMKHRRSEQSVNPAQRENAPTAITSPENAANSEDTIENPANVVETSHEEIREKTIKTEREDDMDVAKSSKASREPIPSPENESEPCTVPEAEDLTVNRNSNVNVIVSPKSAIRETA